MGVEPKVRRAIALLTLTVGWVVGATTSTLAQENTKAAAEKWRPKDGVYSAPGKNFDQQCGEFGDLALELARKKVGGMEWSCSVSKIANTGPNVLRLNLVCEDADIVEDVDSNPDPSKRTQKEVVTQRNEVMTLRKRDTKSLFWSVTQNGKFEGSEWKSAYCPPAIQRSFAESVARDDAKARLKAATTSGQPSEAKQ